MSDRLWSPQMRKWARNSDRHGIPIGFHKAKPGRYRERWEGGGSVYLIRVTDDFSMRIIDPEANSGQHRTVDIF